MGITVFRTGQGRPPWGGVLLGPDSVTGGIGPTAPRNADALSRAPPRRYKTTVTYSS